MGGGARLERFAQRVTDRPHPLALGERGDPAPWRSADLRYDRDTGWNGGVDPGEPWLLGIAGLTMELRPTEAGQVGIFPEHAALLPWLADPVVDRYEAEPHGVDTRPPTVLNLFAYTGLTTLALAAAGVAVTHLDAARPTVAWARRNAEHSSLADRPVRWIVDDALAFSEREVRRGRTYDGVILDPPSYGHGPGGQTWRIEHNLERLLAVCARLLQPSGFLLLTAHTPDLWPGRLAQLVASALDRPDGEVERGPLGLETVDGRVLELGAFARSSRTR